MRYNNQESQPGETKMKIIATIEDTNHPALTVCQELNSFGDQKLIYTLELKDGSKFNRVEINEEGQWVTNDDELKRWALVHFGEHEEYLHSLL